MITVHCKPCMLCGHTSSLEVPDDLAVRAQAFVDDRTRFGLVQDEFPRLTKQQREQLMTGSHPQCWDDMFGDNDEVDDDDV